MDEDYADWSFINNQGDEVDHFYTPIYNGANVSSVLRSMSGLTPINAQTGTTEITYAKANNLSDNVLWYTEVYADAQLINYLLILMGCSTNTQETYGNGHYTGESSASNLLKTGTMDTKGMFWGTNGTGSGVKVFGMENWWKNQWRRYAGHVNVKGTQKIKLTYGTQDGSTTTGYNTDGTGYITIGATPSGTSGGYISKMYFTRYGMFPQVASGSETTFYCDGLWFNNSQIDYAYRGGLSTDGLRCGAFAVFLSVAVSFSDWTHGAALSCKPFAQ